MERVYLAMRNGLTVWTREAGGWSARSRQPADRLECVGAGPRAPDRVFCGTFDEGLLCSRDGGGTFDRVGRETIAQDAVMSLAIDPTDPETILVGTEPSAIYRSTDAGETWTSVGGLDTVPSASEWSFPPRPELHHVRWIEIAPDDPARWYVGIEAGAFLLTPDGGETWIDRPPGSRRDNHWIATHQDAPDRVYTAAGDGYAESRDRGDSWTQPQEGLDHRYVWSVAVDPADPDTRYVSAAHGASRAHRSSSAESYVYRRQGDEAWMRLTDRGLPMGEGVLRPVLAPGEDAGEIFAASDMGLFRTTTGGETWEVVAGSWPEHYAGHTARGLIAF